MVTWEQIDLNRVSARLARRFGSRPPVGYLRGKTAMRDALATDLECSAVDAEALIDTLESRGFLRFDGDPSQRSEADAPWLIETGRQE